MLTWLWATVIVLFTVLFLTIMFFSSAFNDILKTTRDHESSVKRVQNEQWKLARRFDKISNLLKRTRKLLNKEEIT